MNGLELITGVFVSLNTHKPEMIDPENPHFISLTKAYGKFLASSVYSDNKKNFCFWIGYKRVKSLFAQVKGIHHKFETVIQNSVETSDAKDSLLLSGFLMRYFNEIKYSGLAQFKVILF